MYVRAPDRVSCVRPTQFSQHYARGIGGEPAGRGGRIGFLSKLAAKGREPHGQAPVAAFRSEGAIDRQIDALVGIAKGVVANGDVNLTETEFLLRWMETNRAGSEMWPAKVLFPRLVATLADGVLDDGEERGEKH